MPITITQELIPLLREKINEIERLLEKYYKTEDLDAIIEYESILIGYKNVLELITNIDHSPADLKYRFKYDIEPFI